MIEIFLLISGVSAILTSSLRCSAKDCESCSFLTGCLWQSTTMSCVEATSCAPLGACVDRISFCSPRAMLAKALQEGRVETQIFSAFDRAWAPQDKPSFTCQLDECSTSLDPKNLCKVVAGVNLEVRTSTDPKAESTMYTKYMYVCICGAEWDSGPNHRYCRRRVQNSAYGLFPEPGPGYGVGYFHTYGDKYGYGPSYGPGYGYGKPSGKAPSGKAPPLPLPPLVFPLPKSLPPSKSTKQPRLIQFEYDDRFVPRPNNNTPASQINSSVSGNNDNMTNPPESASYSNAPSYPRIPASSLNSGVLYPLYSTPPVLNSSLLERTPNPSPSAWTSVDYPSGIPLDRPFVVLSDDSSISLEPPSPSTQYPIIIPGEDHYSDPYYENVDDEGIVIIVPGENEETVITRTEEFRRNRTTLASLIPLIEEGYLEDDSIPEYGPGGVRVIRKNIKSSKKNNSPTKAPKGEGSKGEGSKGEGSKGDSGSKGEGAKSSGSKGANNDKGRTREPTPYYVHIPEDIPPTASSSLHVDPLQQQPLAPLPPSYYSLQSSEQMRLEYLEILVYSLSGALAVLLVCAAGYYCCHKRKKATLSSPKDTAPNPIHRFDITSIPFRPSVNDLDPEFSRNSNIGSSPLPDLTSEELTNLGQKVCADAWAQLGGLPAKGMSQVVIYYGTPYASVVRPGDSTQSFTEECRSDVLVDVTLCPDESLSTATTHSLPPHTRNTFRYVLRRDPNSGGSVSLASRSQSITLSLVSNTACSSSASGTQY